MDDLDRAQAREHIEMVERILAESSQRLCFGAEYFIVWGAYSALATCIWQLIDNGTVPLSTLWVTGAALIASIVFSIARGRSKAAAQARRSLVTREFFNVLWLTIGLAFIVNVGAFNLFRGFAAAGIWSFAEAIVLLFIGMHGNRRAQLGGVVVVVSMIAANFVAPAIAGYVLAAGMFVGYAGFGVAELLARD